MSWSELKNALQSMRPTGNTGFEGLVAKLLHRLLGIPFIVARSGSQPSGDALSGSGHIHLQTKRYGDRSRMDENSLEGEINNALRHVPKLEVYVIAATRTTAQLHNRLKQIEQDTGIDIIQLDYTNEISDLGALCVSFWDIIERFPRLGGSCSRIRSWAISIRNTPELEQRISTLRERIRTETNTFNDMNGKNNIRLAQRFGMQDADDRRFAYPVKLTEAVHRTVAHSSLLQWNQSNSPVCYLEGEEGYGKSWIAADFAWTLANQRSQMVIWLDSEAWGNASDFQSLLTGALNELLYSDSSTLDKLVRKALLRWPAPILIVLDGVNERWAIESAKRLLREYFNHSELKQQFRILFTTRPLMNTPRYEASLWTGCHKIVIEPFTDQELCEALQRFAPGETIDTIPAAIIPFVKIPRYFQACLRLRTQLESFSSISKELILWEDLLNKITTTDPQIHQQLGWNNRQVAESVLADMARHAEFDISTQTGRIRRDNLELCFDSRYLQIRQDLIEQRILVDANRGEATLNRHHVILGWALYLQNCIYCCRNWTPEHILEVVERELEPMSGDDDKVEAVYVALNLTLIDDDNANNIRAALLYAWFRSHNASFNEERLIFWCNRDIQSYAQFVEYVFHHLYFAETQNLVISPIAQKWISADIGSDELREILKKWLLLCWKPDLTPGVNTFNFEGAVLPIASSRHQLRLSSIAISLLSLRPEVVMLPSLALATATTDASVDAHHIKDIYKNISLLMKWSYTESVVSELDRLFHNEESAVMRRGLQKLASLLRLHELPAILTPEFHHENPFRIVQYTDRISEGRSIFERDQDEFLQGDIENLAIRFDIPDLIEADRNIIHTAVLSLAEAGNLYQDRYMSVEQSRFERIWPWFTRYFPGEVSRISSLLLNNAENMDNPYILVNHVNGSLPLRNYGPGCDVLESISLARNNYIATLHPNAYQVCGRLFELVLFMGNETEITEWIRSVENIRFVTSLHPIPMLLDILNLSDLHNYSRTRIKELLENPGCGDNSESLHTWLTVYAREESVVEADFDWALEELVKCPGDNEIAFWYANIMALSNPKRFWDTLVQDSNLCRLYHLLNISFFERTTKFDFSSAFRDVTYDTLLNTFNQDFVGTLLLAMGREDEFNNWGDDLLKVSLSRLSDVPFQQSGRNGLEFIVNENGRTTRISMNTEANTTITLGSSSSSWGVDYDRLDEFQNAFSENREQEDEQEFQNWRSDLERLKRWDNYVFSNFNSINELCAYAERNSEQFVKLAEEYLTLIEAKSAMHYCMGAFTHALICALLPLKPEYAYKHYLESKSASVRIDVVTPAGSRMFEKMLWNTAKCSRDEHRALRRDLIRNTKNDEELLYVCMAAFEAGAAEELRHLLTEELIVAPNAKTRCLGVSVMPWYADETSFDTLTRLRESDPSDWVRENSAWAENVAKQEFYSRTVYREALDEEDIYLVNAKLQLIKSTLLPIAKWWHRDIEERNNFWSRCDDKKKRGLIAAFWHHWESSSKSKTDIEAFGRKLNEYCRGDKIDKQICSHMAPWWELNANSRDR